MCVSEKPECYLQIKDHDFSFIVLILLTFVSAFTSVLGGRRVLILLCVPLLCGVTSGHNKNILVPYCRPRGRRAKFGTVEKKTRHVNYFKLYLYFCSDQVLNSYYLKAFLCQIESPQPITQKKKHSSGSVALKEFSRKPFILFLFVSIQLSHRFWSVNA